MSDGKAKRKSPLVWLYLIAGVVICGLLGWSSLRLLQDTPSRQAAVEIPGQGWVTVEFTTSPFPPVATKTVTLSFMPTNSRGVMVDFGPGLPFAYGQRGSETPLDAGLATLDSGGMFYLAGVDFPADGDYWVDLDVGDSRSVRFQFNVRPGQ
jgi:hypothetical protein